MLVEYSQIYSCQTLDPPFFVVGFHVHKRGIYLQEGTGGSELAADNREATLGQGTR
jgi:hypothetical protein